MLTSMAEQIKIIIVKGALNSGTTVNQMAKISSIFALMGTAKIMIRIRVNLDAWTYKFKCVFTQSFCSIALCQLWVKSCDEITRKLIHGC